MCICVDCRWVDRCKTYYSVERQHGVEHLNANPDLEPVGPKIHISVVEKSTGDTEIEWDVRACKTFFKDQGRWMRLRPGEEIPA